MESVYVHIPFCKSICSYCDFCKVLYNGPWITQYLNALINEINDRYLGEEIKTLYIGGGTPSSLQIKDLKYLFEITKKFDLSKLEEFTFECNLNDINEEMLVLLKENGVNRLSIGIESFNENKLKFMERSHTFKEADEKIKLARRIGFDNINVDLIYGIPGETVKDLKKDINLMLKLNPDHISTYSLIVEDNTKIAINGVQPIPEELDATMFETVIEKLENKKFEHYEISNFALVDKKSEHNMTYWNNEEYYGFGVGAHGYIQGIRYENTRSITEYIKGKYLLREEVLSKEDIMYNELMLGFRKIDGISLERFYNKFGVNLQEVFDLREVMKDDEILYEDGYLFINPKYIYVMNEILIKIL
ncbi:MAG: radical SAM family heme chaperone HemW [Bacilli bacterium]|nr:radical SAM family heme chaperone HemW [Bacilli bacterium]